MGGKKNHTEGSNPTALDRERMERFCLYYAADPNATEAVIQAGYTQNRSAARTQGSRLLVRADVQRRLTELMSITASALGITRQKVMKRYADIAFTDVRQIFDENNHIKDFNKLTEEQAACIAGVEVFTVMDGMGTITKVKLRDSKASNDGLVKMLGWSMPEKIEVTPDESIMDKGIENLSNEEKLILYRLKKKMTGDEGA